MSENQLHLPTMRLTVVVPFVRGCDECRTLVEGAAISAIRDTSVTSITLQPGKLHAHATKVEPTPTPTLLPSTDDQPALFTPELPRSDTNGFDPNL